MTNFHTKTPECMGSTDQSDSVKKIKTAQEARAWFSEHGISIAEWCRKNALPYKLTYAILAGKKRCERGVSHQIAVLLGMKHGTITRSPEEARQRKRQPKAAVAAADSGK